MSGDRSGFSLPHGTLEPVKIDLEAAGIVRMAGASVGKKYLMAIVGLIWCFFVLAHLLGNLLFFAGADVYNAYSAHLLALGPVLIVLEAGLVFFLLLHVVLSLVVVWQNWKARPVSYKMDVAKGGRTVASSTMIYTGVAILFFIVVHLLNLKYGELHTVGEQLDIHGAVVALFSSNLCVLGYVIAVCLVGLHVSHAIQSSLRTLGWNSERSYARVNTFSRLFGLFVALGYAAIPISVILSNGGA